MAELRRSARTPTHPGAVLCEDVMLALVLSEADLARHLGVDAAGLAGVLNEQRSIDVDLAARLGKLCGNGPGLWLRMQAAYDAWVAERIDTSGVPTIRAA